jgi:hypothetical protein
MTSYQNTKTRDHLILALTLTCNSAFLCGLLLPSPVAKLLFMALAAALALVRIWIRD